MDSLKKLFVNELQDIYDAEKRLVEALPKMAKAASSSELSDAFTDHLRQTKEHVKRLETVFKNIGESARTRTCAGIQGIIKEGEDLLRKDAEDSVVDAGLIAAGQRAEHYEMAVYGTLNAWAKTLGEDKSAELLQQTLDEESAADAHLTEIARSINSEASEHERKAA